MEQSIIVVVLLAIGGLIFAALIAIAPLFIWLNVRALRRELTDHMATSHAEQQATRKQIHMLHKALEQSPQA